MQTMGLAGVYGRVDKVNILYIGERTHNQLEDYWLTGSATGM